MEKVLGCRTINQGGDIVGERGATETSCVERSFGEGNVKESTRGGVQRKEGSAPLEPTVGSDCSQVQLGDMGASEHGFFSTSTSSLSSYIPPTPRRLGLQLSLSTSLLKRSPTSSNQVAEEPPRRSVQPDVSQISAVVAPHVQADWSAQQRQSLLGGGQEKQESPLPIARRDQQQCPPPRQWRLPLPKLKSLVRPKSTPKQKVERRTDLEEGSSSQTPQKIGDTPSATSSNSSMFTGFEQEEMRSSAASPCAQADSENKFCIDKLGRKSVPKLNFFSGSGLFKRSKDKDSVDGQSQLPPVSGNVSCDFNQQACATVPTEAGDQQDQLKVADQDCGKESDLEEGEFFDAVCKDVAGAGTVVEGGNDVEEGHLEVEEGERSEASLPATSSMSAPTSPHITPGKRRLPPLKLSPGTALNDSKRESAYQELLDGISQEQEQTAVPSLPKAP